MRRVRVSPEAYRRITLLALVALCLIVVTGAAVRLTDSGLGCSDWPTCEHDRLVAPLEYHAMVEFVNRLITGLVSVAVALAVLGSLRRTPRRDDLVKLSWGLVAGVVGQILLGGITVLLDLAPVAVMAHFLVSMALVTTAVVLHRRAGEPDGWVRRPDVTPSTLRLGWAMVGLASAVLFVGTLVTGTGPHGGDPDVDRLPLAIREVLRVHGGLAWLLTALVLVVMVRTRRGWPVLAAVAAQITIGYVQYFNGVPAFLVGLHVAGATLVWIAVVWLHLSLWTVVPASAVGTPEAELVRA